MEDPASRKFPTGDTWLWRTMAMVMGEAPRDAEVGNSGTGADFPGSRLKQEG